MQKYLLLAQKTFRELAERGVVLDPASDMEEIHAVALYARRVFEPTDPALERRLLSPVVKLGPWRLRSLPIGVRAALVDLTAGLAETDFRVLLSHAYAAAHTGDVAFWQDPPSPRVFRRLVRSWGRRLRVDRVELAAAIAELGQREYEALRSVPGDIREVGVHRYLEILVGEYGKDADYWLWVASNDEIEALLSGRNERLEDEEREIAKSARDGKHPLLSPNSYQVRAMQCLIDYRDGIVEKRAAKGEEAERG